MIDIVHVEFHPLVEGDIAAAADLPQAGYAGFDAESAAVDVVLEALEIAHRQRARAHQAHVTLEYVEKLW